MPSRDKKNEAYKVKWERYEKVIKYENKVSGARDLQMSAIQFSKRRTKG